MRTFLPMADHVRGKRSAVTCALKCDNACLKATCNTSSNGYFRDIVGAKLSRRAVLGASAAAVADDLSIGFADPLSSLDPQLNNHAGDRSVALHFWDLLIENKENKLQPGLAVSWKPLDDKTWEFKLREGVKWQDGTPFTADDLIYSYTRARAVPGSVATYAGYLRTIDSMSAKDPLTLIVKTKAPNPDLPLNLASVHVVSKHVGEKSTTEDYNSGKAMIGTGERIRVEVVDPAPLGEEALEGLRRLEHVRTAAYQDGEVLIECSPGAHNLTDVMRALDAAGATSGRVTSEPPTLNDVFLEITGRALRDEAA